ncbi:hypothetical protein FUA48_08585 [Flavobacterium alkalisoli]|uniref:Uncharacterized protein n=1 Tax=Flavobacterium alkalisoli TaxID=2602769 RepID=A0A5B9FY08_9FLAO|nr:hypothetical protein [Flavobacterium alkalisoli]QEE49637.1 hypothetical protein FUA48_08585 [Flavobacterium alkalisoli]
MKKLITHPLFYWFSFILLMLAISVLPIGCGAFKRPQKVVVQTENKTNIDSLLLEIKKLTKVNREINDKTSIYIPDLNTGNDECDSICNARMREMLVTVNRVIESGNNKYQLLYNEHSKTIDLLAKMAETQDSNTETNREQFKSEESEVVKPVIIKVIPAFWRYSAYLGWAAALLIVFTIFNRVKSWGTKKFFTSGAV